MHIPGLAVQCEKKHFKMFAYPTSRRSRTLPLGPRLGRKTRPHPTGSQRRGNLGGRKKGDEVRKRGVFQRPESCLGGRAL